MEQEFHCVERLTPDVFAVVDVIKAAARAAGEDVIGSGMGNPDLVAPVLVEGPHPTRQETKRSMGYRGKLRSEMKISKWDNEHRE